MSDLAAPAAWTALGWTFLHLLWIGAVVGLAASAARRSMRRASPEARHAVALAGLLILAVAPFATFAAIHRPPPEPTSNRPIEPAAAGTGRAGPTTATTFASPTRTVAAREVAPPAPWWRPWVEVLPGVWLVGSTLALARLAVGLAGVERMRRAATLLEAGPVVARCRELAGSLGIARVAVAACDRVAAPALVGIVRPMILLPASALTGWSPDQVEMALLHELAHLRRRDNLVGLFQKLVEALLFFHPTTWWLSAWLRLERETCCDRLVVARTGRPRAYAELLAALAGAGPARAGSAALSERPIAARIRRILFKEDRPMTLKPTAPEALALAAATLVAAALALPTRAEPPAGPKPVVADLRRMAEKAVADLRRMAEKAVAEAGPEDRDALDRALMAVAAAQVAHGDPEGALASLTRIEPPDLAELDAQDGEARDKVGLALDAAMIRRDAGDPEGARELALAITKILIPTDPAVLPHAARRLSEMFNESLAREGEVFDAQSTRVVLALSGRDGESRPVPAPAPGDEERRKVESAALKMILLIDWFGEPTGLLSAEEDGRLMAAITSFSEGMDEPARTLLRAEMRGQRAARDARPGASRGRALADDLKAAYAALPDGPMKDRALLRHVQQAAMAADLDGGLDLIATLRPELRPEAYRSLTLGGLTVGGRGWSPESGFLGSPLAAAPQVRDKAAALAGLPRLTAAIRGLASADERRRLLATAAQVQAACGDFAGALATADEIPDWRPGDAEAADARLDDATWKPFTFAVIASLQAEAGDQAAADATFARAERIVESVPTEIERGVARVALAERLARAGRDAAARVMIDKALSAILAQAEPRRSRLLCLLVDAKARVDGVAEAAKLADAVREEPGIEKAFAFRSVAFMAKEAGDAAASRALALKALPYVEPRDSDPKATSEIAIAMPDGLSGYLDPEIQAGLSKIHRKAMQPSLRELAGLAAEEGRKAAPRLLAPGGEAAQAYHRDGLDAAMAEVDAMKTPTTRLVALQRMAESLGRKPRP